MNTPKLTRPLTVFGGYPLLPHVFPIGTPVEIETHTRSGYFVSVGKFGGVKVDRDHVADVPAVRKNYLNLIVRMADGLRVYRDMSFSAATNHLLVTKGSTAYTTAHVPWPEVLKEARDELG